MQRYMLDTHIVSHLLRQQPQVVAHVMAVPIQALCISAMTEGELLFGLGATLVTNDRAIGQVGGLQVEDWTLPGTAPVRH